MRTLGTVLAATLVVSALMVALEGRAEARYILHGRPSVHRPSVAYVRITRYVAPHRGFSLQRAYRRGYRVGFRDGAATYVRVLRPTHRYVPLRAGRGVRLLSTGMHSWRQPRLRAGGLRVYIRW